MGLLTFIKKNKAKNMITFEKFQCTTNQLLVLPIKDRPKDNYDMMIVGKVVKTGPVFSTVEYEDIDDEIIPGEEWKDVLPNDMRNNVHRIRRKITNERPYEIDDIVFYSGKHVIELNGLTYHMVSHHSIDGYIKGK